MSGKKKLDIRKAVKHPGRVRGWVDQHLGPKGFDVSGRITKASYQKALAVAKSTGDTSLERAVILAQRLTGSRKLDPRKYTGRKREFDLPEPGDYELMPDNVLVRLVPSIDNLMEVAIYLPASQYDRLKSIINESGIKIEVVNPGYLARRGRTYQATNIFLIRGD